MNVAGQFHSFPNPRSHVSSRHRRFGKVFAAEMRQAVRQSPPQTAASHEVLGCRSYRVFPEPARAPAQTSATRNPSTRGWQPIPKIPTVQPVPVATRNGGRALGPIPGTTDTP